MPVHLPNDLLNSLEVAKGFNKEAFINVHQTGKQVTSIRMNPFKPLNGKSEMSIASASQLSPFPLREKVPWTEHGYYLDTRPSFTFDPLFHAGCYYVQEASSMFLEQAFTQLVDLSQPLRVLDLCAAPGGKSTHILSLISNDSLLVSNEVIRSRANILNDNIIKWGCSNVVVTNNDPKDFQRLKNYFDVIVIDAPCSGSGLFRRDPEAIEEWSEHNVKLCSQRQQRIIVDALPALKNGGVLIYSTCSYSREEDEHIVEWLRDELTNNKVGRDIFIEELNIRPEWNIVASNGGYRFWPDKVKGEGFFIACFRKNIDDDQYIHLPGVKAQKLPRRDLDLLNNYVVADEMTFISSNGLIRAIPEKILTDLNFLSSSKLRVLDYGTKIGEIIREKLVPDHALAMSRIISDKVQRVDLSYEQAIQYLKKKELSLATDKKGWALVIYQGHPLGWINILSNRINNYYPKELRILKE